MRGRQDIDSPYAGMNRIKFAGSVEFTVSAPCNTLQDTPEPLQYRPADPGRLH